MDNGVVQSHSGVGTLPCGRLDQFWVRVKGEVQRSEVGIGGDGALIFCLQFGVGEDVPCCGKGPLQCRREAIALEVVGHLLTVRDTSEGVVAVAVVPLPAPAQGRRIWVEDREAQLAQQRPEEDRVGQAVCAGAPAHCDQGVRRLRDQDAGEVVDVLGGVPEHCRVEGRHVPPAAVGGDPPARAVHRHLPGEVAQSLVRGATWRACHLCQVREELVVLKKYNLMIIIYATSH